MRIGFVYDAAYPYVAGGAERRYHELAKRLARRHEVHYVTWRHWNGPADIVEDGVHLHGIGDARSFYGNDGKRTVSEAVSFSLRLIPYLARQRWDVIDCSATPYLPLYATAAASLTSRTPFVATWHEFWGARWSEYLPHRPVIARIASRIEASSRRFGGSIVAVSPFTARQMDLDTAGTRVHVVPNGVDLGEIDAIEPWPDGPELVYVGRLIDDKRVDLLIEAVHELRGPFPDLRCAIVGDGPERGALERLVGRLDLSERVSLLGRLEGADPIATVKSARLFVQPSLREGFGMTVLEAQAAGTVPVVVRSPWSAATDLVEHGVNGLIADPTVASLASAIAAALSDEQRRRRMSDAARRSAAMFDWDAITDTMEQVYAAHATANSLAGRGESLECS
jgi:glycosyltransferase involved in cell wall biosynthesis